MPHDYEPEVLEMHFHYSLQYQEQTVALHLLNAIVEAKLVG